MVDIEAEKKALEKIIVLALILLSNIFISEAIATGETQYHHVLTIQSPELESDAYFGYSIACDEGFIIVGEVWSKVEGKTNAGKVYIFDIDGNLITSLQSPTPMIQARFGGSVAFNGDIIVIGEPLVGVDEINNAGKVYIFDKEGKLQATLTSLEPDYLGRFGYKVAICGNKIVVSESGADYGDFLHAGMVHVYDLDGNLLTSIQSPEPFGGGGSGGNFGYSLAVDRDIVVVGEVHTTVDDKIGAGRAFIFDLNGDLLASLQSPEPQTEGEFSQAVAVYDEFVIVGEHYAEVEGISKAGKVHVFNLEGNLLFSLHSPEPEETALFGRKVTVSKDLIIVGERGTDGATEDEGKVHLFDLSGNWIATLKAPNPSPGGEFGSFVVVNEESIVVGERSAVMGEYKAGQVHVYRLGSTIEVQEPVEETPPVTEEKPETDETGNWIPGFPIVALVLGLLFTVIYFTQRKQ